MKKDSYVDHFVQLAHRLTEEIRKLWDENRKLKEDHARWAKLLKAELEDLEGGERGTVRKSKPPVRRRTRTAKKAPAVSGKRNGKKPATKKLAVRKSKPLSPARKKALAIQGRYMGLLRSLTPDQKQAVKAIRAKHGTAKAIDVMQRRFKRAGKK